MPQPSTAKIEQAIDALIRAVLGGEWFNVTREEAVDAVQSALNTDVIEALDPYNMIPPTCTPPNNLKGGEYLRTKVVSGTSGRIKAVLAEGETHADLIRAAIENEVERRERARPSTPAEHQSRD